MAQTRYSTGTRSWREKGSKLDSPLFQVVVVTAVFFCLARPFLGDVPLIDPDEGYYPRSAVEMMERGNWFDPVFNGEARWGKPIGFYVAECLSFRWFGVSERSARLPSLAAGLGFVWLALALGWKLYGPRTGFYSGLVMSTAVQPVVYSRTAVPDMMLALFVSLALYGFVRTSLAAAGGGGKKGFRLMYLGCALAFLAKGPLGVILPGITVLLFLILSGGLGRIKRLGLVNGALIFLLAVAPWFVYMYVIHGTAYLNEFFFQGNLMRYFTNRYEHAGPFYYYLPILILGAFPWTVAFVGGAVDSFRSLLAVKGRESDGPGGADLFLWCWLGGMLIFFSFSQSKLPNYVLPLYPAVALMAARMLRKLEKSTPGGLYTVVVGFTAALALAVLAAGMMWLPGRMNLPYLSIALTLSPVAVLAAVSAIVLARRSVHFWIGAGTVCMALFLALASGYLIPRIDYLQAVRKFSREQLADLRPGERIMCFEAWAPSLLFYTGHGVVRYNPDTDSMEEFISAGGRWVFTRERHLGNLAELVVIEPKQVYQTGDRVLVQVSKSIGRGRTQEAPKEVPKDSY